MHYEAKAKVNRKRTHHVQVWLDDDEFQQLNLLVAKTKRSRESVLRELISGLTVKEAPIKDFSEVIYELRHIGNNLNQLTATLHSKNFFDERRHKQACDAIHQLEERLSRVYMKEE